MFFRWKSWVETIQAEILLTDGFPTLVPWIYLGLNPMFLLNGFYLDIYQLPLKEVTYFSSGTCTKTVSKTLSVNPCIQ